MTELPDLDEIPETTLDIAELQDFRGADFAEIVNETLLRLAYHGSIVITDRVGRAFDGFLVNWWRGVYVVRGAEQRHLGTFVSIEAAIASGLTAPRRRAGKPEGEAR